MNCKGNERMAVDDLYSKCQKKAQTHQMFYHYTNLEALLYILSSGAFRLSLISNMNDLEEENRFLDIKKNKVFVACFNHDKAESIPLWKIYSKDNYGLRLGFSSIDFLANKDKYYYVSEGKKVRFPCDKWEIRDALITDVEYVEDPNDHVAYSDPLDTGAKVPYPINLGIIKRKAWEYEAETRARVYIDVVRGVSSLRIEEKSLDPRNPFINHVFCRLTRDEIENMTITFSPFMNNAMKDFIVTAVTTQVSYFKESNFLNSELDGKIRI